MATYQNVKKNGEVTLTIEAKDASLAHYCAHFDHDPYTLNWSDVDTYRHFGFANKRTRGIR